MNLVHQEDREATAGESLAKRGPDDQAFENR